MRTLEDIHAEIDRDTERRAELWHLLSEGHDPNLASELSELNDRLEALWAEHRQTRPPPRFGARARSAARAGPEKRLKRPAPSHDPPPAPPLSPWGGSVAIPSP